MKRLVIASSAVKASHVSFTGRGWAADSPLFWTVDQFIRLIYKQFEKRDASKQGLSISVSSDFDNDSITVYLIPAEENYKTRLMKNRRPGEFLSSITCDMTEEYDEWRQIEADGGYVSDADMIPVADSVIDELLDNSSISEEEVASRNEKFRNLDYFEYDWNKDDRLTTDEAKLLSRLKFWIAEGKKKGEDIDTIYDYVVKRTFDNPKSAWADDENRENEKQILDAAIQKFDAIKSLLQAANKAHKDWTGERSNPDYDEKEHNYYYN